LRYVQAETTFLNADHGQYASVTVTFQSCDARTAEAAVKVSPMVDLDHAAFKQCSFYAFVPPPQTALGKIRKAITLGDTTLMLLYTSLPEEQSRRTLEWLKSKMKADPESGGHEAALAGMRA
jgi:hypothetical protein